jgi:hypothetical protein
MVSGNEQCLGTVREKFQHRLIEAVPTEGQEMQAFPRRAPGPKRIRGLSQGA